MYIFIVVHSVEGMKCLWSTLLVSAILPQWSSEVELTMQGTVNLGQDVVQALSRYVEMKKPLSRRLMTRRFTRNKPGYLGTDGIRKIVDEACLCRNIGFCQGELGEVINKFVTTLTEGVEIIFESLVNAINNDEEASNVIIFEEELRELIGELRTVLKVSENETKECDKTIVWANVIKKINAKFVERAISFAGQRLEGSPKEIFEVKKKVTQKIIIVTSVIELEFENILCKRYSICTDSFECTKSLAIVLENLKSCSEDSTREFIKHFREELPGTRFYTTLSDETAASFQTILREMSHSDNILTKKVLSAFHKSVEDRQTVVISKYEVDDRKFGRDVKLVHIILSDMDFIFSKLKAPFHDFLSDFFYWLKEGGRFGLSIRRVLKDIQNKLSITSGDLVIKLILEVKVFLELTVDPGS